MADSPWWTFVQRISNAATAAQIARDTQLDKSAPSRWSRGGGVEAAQAVRVARAYGANVLEALVAAGYISPDEVELTEVARGVGTHSSLELLHELVRREEVAVGGDRDDVDIDELGLAADTADQSPDEDLRTP